MNNEKMGTTDIRRLRSLASSWLQGTTSPEEERELSALAISCESEGGAYPADLDSETLGTLRLIAAAARCSDTVLANNAAGMPAELEVRLRSHIHSLASRGQSVGSWRRILLRYAGAAAVVAMAAVGVRYFVIHEPVSNPGNNITAELKDTTSVGRARTAGPLIMPSEAYAQMKEGASEKVSPATQQPVSETGNRKKGTKKKKVTVLQETQAAPDSPDAGQEELLAGINLEEVNHYASILDRTLTEAKIEIADINNRLFYDFHTVENMLDNIEGNLELSKMAIRSINTSPIAFQRTDDREPTVMPTDPMDF